MKTVCLATLLLLTLGACQDDVAVSTMLCSQHGNNDGLTLQDGFCAIVVADSLGRARHLTVRDNGDIFVALRQQNDHGAIAALRDTDGDGRADTMAFFGDIGGTGIHLRGDYLYFAADTFIVRYPMGLGLVPIDEAEPIVTGFVRQRSHAVKPFEFDNAGNLYVNIGAPSNACMEQTRTPESPGQDPCPLLEGTGGVWRFAADQTGQTLEDGIRYATGIRNGVANAWNTAMDKLYVVQHGRDDLHRFWPDRYTEEQNNDLPSEEFFEVEEGDDFGWPYCYHDHLQGLKLLNPEYGGDGALVGRCADMKGPIHGFPGHWAPNDLLFYQGTMFPERFHGGVFVAFHGSWNRSPVQQGFQITFLPFADGAVTGDPEMFADGFAGANTVAVSNAARARPTGLATGPDGSLYISDSVKGRIWRIVYVEI